MNTNTEKFQNRKINKDIFSSEGQTENTHPDFYLDDKRLLSLQNLCNTINPYSELSLEEKFLLKEFGISDSLDPFSLTNRLIFLLEENIQYRTAQATNK